MKIKHYYFFIVLFFFMFISCSPRNLVYFNDLSINNVIEDSIQNYIGHNIQKLDLLKITVSTLNPESNLLFNSGILSNIGSSGNNSAVIINEGYRVDTKGIVNFPVLGKIELEGMTIEEATDKMTNLLEKEAKNPIVNIKLLNFRITVIGEVNRPNTFPVITEKINIIEAIGLAGDLTPFGKRENVLLLREQDGNRTTVRLDLNKQELLRSPYFYLKQNDIVYVEPVRARGVQASMGRQNLTLALSLLSVFSIVAFRIFR